MPPPGVIILTREISPPNEFVPPPIRMKERAEKSNGDTVVAWKNILADAPEKTLPSEYFISVRTYAAKPISCQVSRAIGGLTPPFPARMELKLIETVPAPPFMVTE